MPRFLKLLLFRYRGLHVLLLLLFSLLLQFLYHDREMPFLPQWVGTLIVVALCAAAAGVAANRLVPRLLYTKRKVAFVAALLGISLLNSLIIYLTAGFVYSRLSGREMFPSIFYMVYIMAFFFVANIVVISIACALRIISDRFGMEDRLAEIERDKISTELAFLRAQTNPHFLFNVLNTIYFQIKAENVAARNSVEKLADILRYQLYECTTDQIEIEKEIANIRNYVSLQYLRLEPGTIIQLEVSDELYHFMLAPLLILPLVENAFKHLSHFKNPADNQLYVHLFSPEEGIFVAEISNTYNVQENTTQLISSGGLGLPNLQRRLMLLYPEKYRLEVSCDGKLYQTKLQIIYDDQVPAGGRRTDSAGRADGVHSAD